MVMTAMNLSVEHIMIDDDGIPRTRTMGVKVKMIAAQYLEGGMPVEEIAQHYDISQADVHGALAYFYDHKDYFLAQAAELAPLIEKSKAESAQRLMAMRARLDKRQSDGPLE